MTKLLGLTNKNPLNKISLLFIVLIALFSAAIISPPKDVSASAYGCAFGNPSYGPSTYCVNLNGSGTYVNYVSGRFSGGGFVCNSVITAEFFDTNWKWYKTYTAPKVTGCSTGGSKTISIKKDMKKGFMCSTLKYSVTPKGSQRQISVCHRIK